MQHNNSVAGASISLTGIIISPAAPVSNRNHFWDYPTAGLFLRF